ncbi:hypothetical protein ITG08_07515 [Vibrio cyclitrophicus]|uniref:hypothetical protein n=1 Tax=Vibrio cyclitrophicus TaxID=47951 RepID=UPI002052669A|nr:hypothetical protein [Vibrio cyclitrophicus]UPR26543.1 hypothetical protein ITG08_07515 [Vibrio cyclitrophicus]
MAKGKLQRRKIAPKTKATVSPISPSGRFEVYLGEAGKTIPCLDLMDLHDGDKIIRSLNLFLRDKRLSSAKQEAAEVLNYLRFALSYSGVVNTGSLDAYVDEISANPDIEYSTKYQKYIAVKKFAKDLREKGVLPELMPIPEGFDASKIQKKAKASFPELARLYVEDESNFDMLDVNKVAEALDIGLQETQAYVFSLECIDILHQESLSGISAWEKDWDFTQSIIDNLTPEDIAFYKGVEGINDPVFFRERTDQDAIAILYAQFGTKIPAVKDWPKGLIDFLRSIGWEKVGTRVKRLFKGEPVEPEDGELLAFAKGLSKERLKEYKELKDFTYLNPFFDHRTIEHAIAILYVQRGRLLPSSMDWPDNVTDYLKYRGWLPSRVRASLFPTTMSVAPFIVGLLSYIDLSPNVYPVAQYSYLTSFSSSEEDGKVRVYLDKFRGDGGVDKSFDEDDEIIAACVRHTARMKRVLQDVGELGKAVLRKEKPQLFTQYTSCPHSHSGIEVLLPPEESSVTNIVRGFITEQSERHPILKAIIGATGENFRPTNALILRLSGESTGKIQQILNHNSSVTTDLYTERVYAQTTLKTKQKNFMRYLVDNATAPETKLENNKSKSKNDLWDASNDGVDEWINCEAQRIWFHDVEIVAEWVAWERQIAEYEEELKFNNPKRWALYWAPRLAKYKSMLTLVTDVDLKAANEKAVNIVLPPLS